MIGTPRVHWRSTDSTNERARELAVAGAPHGTLVTAGDQSAGRGRQGRVWSAPPGSALLMSVVLRDLRETLPLAAAVAVCEALPAVDCRIKWPNDVQVGGRKLAGVLVEGRPQEGWAVLGVGVNVGVEEFSGELASTATSLALEGLTTGNEEMLHSLLVCLDARLQDDAPAVLAAWRERDALLGQRVRWRDGEGTAAGIDQGGALLVDTSGGRVTLHAGEVHLFRGPSEE